MKMKRYFDPDIIHAHKPNEIIEIRESVTNHGQLRPIITYQGKILDGYILYEILLELGKTPKFQEFSNSTITPEQYRLTTVFGRQITEGQTAVYALRYYKTIKGGLNTHGHNQHSPQDQLRGKNKKNQQIYVAAKKFDVAHGSIAIARLVEKRDRKVFKLLESGEIGLREAYRQVTPKGHSIHKKRQTLYATNQNQHIGGSAERMSCVDAKARKFLDQIDLQDFKPPTSVFAPDSEFRKLDRYMQRLGFDLSVTRTGGTYNATYTPTTNTKAIGHPTLNSALLDASRLVLTPLTPTPS